MKKVGVLIAVLLLYLTGCSNNVPKIDDYDWIMTSVQSVEADGQAVAYGERGSSTLDTAKQVELICKAENGNVTITDKTNNKTYTGTYKLKGTSPESSNYEVMIDGKEGFAVVAMTTYHDNSQDPTFIINLGDYAVNFFAE